ncbi:MAG: GNAT family N-acetyltransferase [Bacillota bacterium]|nr:GNAT family N-acetyltransferase [Bacillota bacterium]
MSVQNITITNVTGIESEYIIKDKLGINIGRVFIIELIKEKKYCSFRIKFYKQGKESYEPLKDALRMFLKSLFNNMDIFKVNVLADENINVYAFTDLGFEIEGIVSCSDVSNNEMHHEILFGINQAVYDTFDIDKKLSLSEKGIELRILTPVDAEVLLDYYTRNKDYLKPYEPTRDESFYTLEVQRRILMDSYKQYLNGTALNFGIYKDDKFIGKVQVSNIIIGIFKSCFVGYSIDMLEQGKGYMKKALNICMDYIFNELQLHRIEATTLVDNYRSQNVLSACGFKKIGVSEKYLYINGKWRDHLIFYKIRN